MTEPVIGRPIEVRARPGEPGEALIKRFTRLVRDEGILRDYRRSLRFVRERRRKFRGK